MPIEANIIVQGHGGSQDINSSRGIGTADVVASDKMDTFSRIIFADEEHMVPIIFLKLQECSRHFRR